MVPLLFLGLLAFLIWHPSREAAARIGVANDEEIYPVRSDVVTVALQDKGLPLASMWQDATRHVTERFASKGYQVAPLSVGSPSIGGITFRRFVVMQAAANLAVPRQLGNGMIVYSVRRG